MYDHEQFSFLEVFECGRQRDLEKAHADNRFADLQTADHEMEELIIIA